MIGTIIKIKDSHVIGIVIGLDSPEYDSDPSDPRYIIQGLSKKHADKKYCMRLSNEYLEIICK